MSKYDKPSTFLINKRVTGLHYAGGKLVILFDNDEELEIVPDANPYTDSCLSLVITKYATGYSEDTIVIEEGYGEGDY